MEACTKFVVVALLMLPVACGKKKTAEQPNLTAENAPKLEKVEAGDLVFRKGLLYYRGGERLFSGFLVDRHENGELKSETRIKDGKPHGSMRGWGADGKRSFGAVYAEGELQEYERLDEDGSSEEIEVTLVGDPVSAIYAEDEEEDERGDTFEPIAGTPVETPVEKTEEPIPQGDVSLLDLRVTNGRAFRGGEPFTGRAVHTSSNGARVERNYVVGHAHGVWTTYFPNGNKRSEEIYRVGKKDGSHTLWFDDGQPRLESNYAEGRQSGITTHWNESGEIIRRWERNEAGQLVNLLEPKGDESD